MLMTLTVAMVSKVGDIAPLSEASLQKINGDRSYTDNYYQLYSYYHNISKSPKLACLMFRTFIEKKIIAETNQTY